MKRDATLWSIVVIALVTIGLLNGRWLVGDIATGDVSEQSADTAFRGWFWEHRTLDLVTQVGLIFAGALGVAAILPGNEDIPPPQIDSSTSTKESQ